MLDTTQPVVAQAKHVSIDDAAIERWAAEVRHASLHPMGHDLLANLPGSPAKLANLVLLVDALNFCFWSPDPIKITWRGETYRRFEAMFVSLMLAARCEPEWCDPEYWLKVSSEDIRQVLGGTGQLLLMDERERIVRETGQVVVDRFDGQFMNAVESVNSQAWPLAVLLMTNFDSFRDVSTYRGQPVYFMKRAQICALDVAMAWQAQGHPSLDGLAELTAFADYRVPQALRHLGMLRLAPELAEAIDREEEIAMDSEEEVEIRAATIHVVDRMRAAVEKAGKPAPAWQIDWYLWSLARTEDIATNHHRTRTVYY
ncbi:MAG: queuosine salvage family protein [Phycisphaerae bacterium]|nr:queuosine salvage family protein [Phycisphaerae bacterium]